MFLAHTNDLKNKTYIPIEQLNKKNVLILDDCYKLISNVCPHQGSIISETAGDTDIRVCPYHNWSFELSGKPISSGRTNHYCQNTKHLSSKNVFEFNHLLFTKDIACKQLEWLDLSKMRLIEQRVDRVATDPTHIMDIFLDVDHIETVHKGVYDRLGFPSINEVQWHYYDWGSLQLIRKGEVYGAAWLAVYPGTMIEWQDGAMFVTVTKPVTSGTVVHVFKYMDITKEEDWALNNQVWEESWQQDKEQAARMTTSFNTNLEESKKHFRSWSNADTQNK